ncbi:MAG: hypothetical protein ISP91_13915 [Pseudomonadales bacterium]|jgi:hypothetical protein|nr:hypothetical protein [Pseudomonadales bacterium]
MDAFISQHEYALAWSVYLLAGLGFCLFWWKVTSIVRHDGWRDLFRGIALVLMFTPWFSDETHEHFAPAIVVAFMDFLLGGSDNGLAASLALLVATALMLTALIVRRVMARRAAPN